MRLRLSVVICGYTVERWADIIAAVESLRRQTERPHEIIFVADHNDELYAAAVDALSDVTVLANTQTRGLSGARNTGVATATGDVVAFLDDDAAADPEWAARLLDAYRDDSVIGVGGRVVPAWRAARPAWLPEAFLWVVGCSYEGQPTSSAPVRNAIGANMSFRRSVFTQIGGFDPTVGRIGKDAAGCEETEFSIRARRVQPGARIMLEPAAVCFHNVTPDRVRRRYFRRRCAAEGRSKALVSQLAGADAALESERSYVRRVLPRGVVRGVGEAFTGDFGGAGRAYAIIEGFTVTASSYLWTRAKLRRRAAR
jgi:GT2 family glycosyltransferase